MIRESSRTSYPAENVYEYAIIYVCHSGLFEIALALQRDVAVVTTFVKFKRNLKTYISNIRLTKNSQTT